MPEQIFPALDPVIAQALSKSPRMLLRQLDLRVAAGDLIQAKSNYYPTLSAFYQNTRTEDRRQDLSGTLSTKKTYYNLQFTQPLFYWGERRNNVRVGEIRSMITAKQYADAYRTLAQEIRAAYLSLVLHRGQLVAARFSSKLADQALKSGEERVAKKTMAEGAIFQLRIAAEQNALSVESLESSFIQAKDNYATLTGQPAPEEDQIPDRIPHLNYDKSIVDHLLGSFLAEAEPETPSMEAMRQQVTIDDLSYRNQRKRLLPKLNLVAGVSQDEQSYTINSGLKYGVRSTYAGVQVNWSIFDGFATKGAIASALARKRQSEENYRNSAEALRHQAQNAARAIDLAYRQMAINDRLLTSGQDFLKFRKEDFKRGQASETDVNGAQAAYNSAVVSANMARYNFLMREAEFVSLIARDPAMNNLNSTQLSTP